MYDTLRRIWVPTTVIHVLPWNSYQVHTSNGSTYCHMQRHLCECSVKAADTVPSGTTATPQAPMRHHFSSMQPALPQPAQHMQPTPVHLQHWQPRWAKPQLSLPHQLFKECPSTNVCYIPCHTCAPMCHHACMAPRCLIQEIWELSTWTVHRPCFCNVPLYTSPVIHRVKSLCTIFSERISLVKPGFPHLMRQWENSPYLPLHDNMAIPSAMVAITSATHDLNVVQTTQQLGNNICH